MKVPGRFQATLPDDGTKVPTRLLTALLDYGAIVPARFSIALLDYDMKVPARFLHVAPRLRYESSDPVSYDAPTGLRYDCSSTVFHGTLR